MKRLFAYLFGRTDNLKRDSALAERKARFEKMLGLPKSETWGRGKAFEQNSVTINDRLTEAL